MFGKNEIVGKKYFNDAGEKLFITSMFVTLQGEGPYRGEPAFFVRFSKCNLACDFCDSYFDNGDWFSPEELDRKITTTIENHFCGVVPDWARHTTDHRREMVLVVTGGEPMLQKNIAPFLQRMNEQFANTQIESNGLLWQDIPPETTLVVSPKCLEKNGKAVKYLAPNLKVLEWASCLKFVMEANPESPYSSVPDWAIEWKKATGLPIFISPMNIYNKEPEKAKQLRSGKNDISIEERSTVDEIISFWEPGLLNMEKNKENHEYCARYCLEHGFILNLQIHLYASLA